MSGDKSNLDNDPEFQCGVAVSVYQNSGQWQDAAYIPVVAHIVVFHKVVSCKHLLQATMFYWSNAFIQCPAGGDPNCNWAKFEKQKMIAFDVKLSLSTGDTSGLNPSSHDGTTAHSSFKKLGKSVIKNGEMIGVSSDFWNNYEQDIKLAKDLGTDLSTGHFVITWPGCNIHIHSSAAAQVTIVIINACTFYYNSCS